MRIVSLSMGLGLLLGWACATGSTAEEEAASSGGPGGMGTGGGATASAAMSTNASSSGNGNGGAGGAGGSSCGDTMCDPPEDCLSCEVDCGACPPVCGDTLCETPETCVTCAADCPGAADCDGSPMNGCECTTLGCCGTGCQLQHANGLGQFFYDCVALGTHTSAQAFSAANAWPMAGVTALENCTGPGQNLAVCKQTVAMCACWNYAGSNVGRVRLNAISSTCNCAASTDPTWN